MTTQHRHGPSGIPHAIARTKGLVAEARVAQRVVDSGKLQGARLTGKTSPPGDVQKRMSVRGLVELAKSHGRERVPSTDMMQRALTILDRTYTGWLSRATFVNDVPLCREMQIVFTMAFGEEFLAQDCADVADDLEFVFDMLDVRGAGEVSGTDFADGMLRIMADMKPLSLATDLPTAADIRWCQLLRMRRGVDLLPDTLFCLASRAAKSSFGISVALAHQARFIGACNWGEVAASELASAAAALARLVSFLPGSSLRLVDELRTEVLVRAGEMQEAVLAEAAIALLPAPVPPGQEARVALVRRDLLKAVLATPLHPARAARLVRALDFQCDAVLSVAVARAAVSEDAICHCNAADAIALMWSFGQCERHGYNHGLGPHLLAEASTVLCSLLAGRIAAVSSEDVARLAWALGVTGHFHEKCLEALGKRAASCASQLEPVDLARLVWGLAASGVQPSSVQVLVAALLRCARRLFAPEVAWVAGVLGLWAPAVAPIDGINGTAFSDLWASLHRSVSDMTSEELVMVTSAMLRLQRRDDALMGALQRRTLQVGPFDAEGAEAMARCFEEYWQSGGAQIEKHRGLAANFAIQAVRHGAVGGVGPSLAACLAPGRGYG